MEQLALIAWPFIGLEVRETTDTVVAFIEVRREVLPAVRRLTLCVSQSGPLNSGIPPITAIIYFHLFFQLGCHLFPSDYFVALLSVKFQRGGNCALPEH